MASKKKRQEKLVCNYLQFRALLQTNDLTQSGLARFLGVQRWTVNRWCRGVVPVPQYAVSAAVVLGYLNEGLHSEFCAKSPVVHFEPWETLGLQKWHGLRDAKKARAKLIKRYHPDVGGDNRLMQEINNAVDWFEIRESTDD